MNSPIVIFTYNRLDHIKTLINSLKKNSRFSKSKVFVFSDGPKNEIDKKKVETVRFNLKKLLISKNLEIIERKENIGLSKNVINGINQTLNIYEQAIILEDDLEVSPVFLNYMNEALDLYSDSENVASISGYMYPIDPKKFSSNFFFLKLIESWGWGTWKRSWNNFEIDGVKLIKEINEKKLIDEFNLSSGISYYKMLNDNIKGKNDSWAIRWYASTFLRNMVTLFPNKSFVKNTGIDNSGENCNYTTVYNTKINFDYNDQLKKIECLELIENRNVIKSFLSRVKYKRYMETIFSKIKNYSKKLIN